jgi:aldose 1-epimerase
MKIARRRFGSLPDGRRVDLFNLTNGNGLEVSVTNYGGIVTRIIAPDRRGVRADVVLGFDDLEPYLDGHAYLGAIIGRYANRIAGGSFTLDDADYGLARNNPPNHLHGGEIGFDRVLWEARTSRTNSGPRLRLTHVSPDGDEGFPGRLDLAVTYSLTDLDEILIDYRATTDRPTHVNLTNHSYFNLAGSTSQNALGHRLTIDADAFTPVDSDFIPTGELRPVEGTPMDFRRPAVIGARIDDDDPQTRLVGGYDHNWILNTAGDLGRTAARVVEPISGRVMVLRTTEPGVQLYTGNHLAGEIGRDGRSHRPRSAFCLETQHFPDSPNRPEFPSTVLRPGETYRSTTIYRFGVES